MSQAQTVEIKDRPFLVGDKSIARLFVKPINFMDFVKIGNETSTQLPKDGDWQMLNRRLRIKHQVTAFTASDEAVKMDDLSLSQMPRKYAVQMVKFLNADGDKEGKLITEGDVVSESVLYMLGTPIRVKGDSEVTEIVELEFQAQTFGDVEEILAETNPMDQTAKMLQTLARPVGANVNLMAMPSWALEQISLADGINMMELVLPRFLE